MIYLRMKPSVIFLVKSAKTPSSRIRIKDLVTFLDEKGIETAVEYIPEEYRKRHQLFNKCTRYDVVVFQKRLFSWFEFCELRRKAAVLAYDFDDAVYLKNKAPSENPNDYHSATRKRRFKRIVKAADLIIAANSVLATEAGKYTSESKIRIIPSAVDSANINPRDNYSLSTPPVIGWVGTKVTQRYLDYLAPQLCELRKEHEFVLRVISDKGYEHPGFETDAVEWKQDEENCEIRKFDIGIMPLSNDPFSEGKASYKLLQYLANAVPSVASAVGMNKDVADGGKNALLAETPEEFISQISRLLKDEELRRKLGQNGRKLIEKEYSREVIGAKFADAVSSLIKQK